MKKILLVCLIFAALTSCKKDESKKVLYLAHTLPQTHPVHKGIVEFQKALNKKSGGALTIKIFPD